MQEEWQISQLFHNHKSSVYSWLETFEFPWEALLEIQSFVEEKIASLDENDYHKLENNVYIHKSAKVHPSAVFEKNIIISENVEIRPSAYLRKNVFVSENCVLGNSCEFKNCILMDHVQVPHFSYIGDSILGSYAHFGASAITSNFRQDKKEITIHLSPLESIQSGLRKMGAIIGDHVEIGCGAILNPGTLIGYGSRVYPLSSVRYAIPAQSIYKNNGEVHSIIER